MTRSTPGGTLGAPPGERADGTVRRDWRRGPARLGRRRPFAGRAANDARPDVFRSSTGALAGLYPFLDAADLPAIGAFIGWNTVTLRPFSAHPAAWVHGGITSNANVLITGAPGSGKSALIKALVLRLAVFGVRSLVLGDLKGEYGALARFLGVEPVRLGRGLPARLNPLDAGPGPWTAGSAGAGTGAWADEVHRQRVTLLCALLSVRLGRPATPFEESVLSLALRSCTGQRWAASHLAEPTIRTVYEAICQLDEAAAVDLGVSSGARARAHVEPVRHALANMLDGSLGGLFDGPTSTDLDFTGPIVTVDISALSGRSEDTLAMVFACLSSWSQAVTEVGDVMTMVVRDEMWRQLRFPALVQGVDSDLRLQRAAGTIQVVATHRLSDFEAAAPAGSPAAVLATALVGSFDTRVQLAQDTGHLHQIRDAVGLTAAECALMSSWGPAHRGRALWKVGQAGASFPVQLVLSAVERELFHTDQRMAVR